MPNNIVDYDIIITFQTLSWKNYDVVVDFGKAEYQDFDTHISLLYDVGEDSPQDYTGIRVGFPLGREDHIGFLTPDIDDKVFVESTPSSEVVQSSHRYKGSIVVSPRGTNKGVKQSLLMSNATGVSELILPDTPIIHDIARDFDADAWMEKVTPLYAKVHSHDALVSYIDSNFDPLDNYYTNINDDVIWDFDNYSVHGTIYFNYDDRLIYIKKASVSFLGGLNPSQYYIKGVGSLADGQSPLRVEFSYNHGSRRLFDMLKKNASIQLDLLIMYKALRGASDYRRVSCYYGFNGNSWHADHLRQNAHNYLTSNLCRNSILMPLNVIRSGNMVADDTVSLDRTPMIPISNCLHGAIVLRASGTVLGYYLGDVYDGRIVFSGSVSSTMSMSFLHSPDAEPVWLQPVIEQVNGNHNYVMSSSLATNTSSHLSTKLEIWN